MENNWIRVKWQMLNSKHFVGESNGYYLSVSPAFSKMWYWSIIKDQIIIDEATKHSPTYNELAAKVMAERHLNKLIPPPESK